MKLLTVLVTLFLSVPVFASECEVLDLLGVVSEFKCEHAQGSVYHANGTYAGSTGNSWYYSNGKYAGSEGNSWYHSNGNYAGSLGNSWYHKNGNYAGSEGNSMYYANGNYAGSNGNSWYASTGKYVGVLSDLSEMEQLKIVYQNQLDEAEEER